jgi:hypothetical protein
VQVTMSLIEVHDGILLEQSRSSAGG